MCKMKAMVYVIQVITLKILITSYTERERLMPLLLRHQYIESDQLLARGIDCEAMKSI